MITRKPYNIICEMAKNYSVVPFESTDENCITLCVSLFVYPTGSFKKYDVLVYEPYNNANIVYCTYLDSLYNYKLSSTIKPSAFSKIKDEVVKVFPQNDIDNSYTVFCGNYREDMYYGDRHIDYDVKICERPVDL